ncbi:MAG: alkaline shock response membrane anchor protein AmaP [Clostridiaceae bacterium]|nr:alkaline shock response membrane anchor protein AmaP [Clostridiaceae bacterium]
MSILLRILLVIYAVVFIFAAVMSVMVAINNEMLGGIYYRLDSSIASSRYSGLIITVIALFLLVSAILFFIAGLRTTRDKRAVSKYTNIGEVKISLNSIENIALNVASKMGSIRDLKAYVSKIDDSVSITIKGVVLPDVNIPLVSSELQEKVKNAVEEGSGVGVADVKVFIEDIYSGNIPMQKQNKEG